MPIRFRCSYCNRLLGIATRKAGMRTTCPHCGNSITVPAPPRAEERTERINVEDVDELLGKSAGATVKEVPAAAPAPPAPPQARAQEILEPEFEEPLSIPPSPPPPARKKVSKPTPAPEPAAKPAVAKAPAAPKPKPKPPRPHDPDDPPLFEGDVDEILGETAAPGEEELQKPAPAAGVDAMSLGDAESRPITLSSQTATLLMVAVVVLMALSFAAGYLVAPRG
jgi:phage FluMu protein Com